MLSTPQLDNLASRLYCVVMNFGSALLTCLAAMAIAGCNPPATVPSEERVEGTAGPRTFAFPLNLTAQPVEAFKAVNAALTAEGGQLKLEATSDDPQIMLPPLKVSGDVAFVLDLEAPVDTKLELFYQTREAPEFGAERVVAALLHRGRNQILIEVNESSLNGILRLDPGQAPGSYLIHSMTAFGGKPIDVVKSQLAQNSSAVFDAAKIGLFSANTPEDLSRLQPVKDIEIAVSDNGAKLRATGPDPQFLLPEFNLSQPLVVKVVLTAPSATVLQLFYKHSGDADYSQANMQSIELKPGDNTAYFILTDPQAIGALRLDPGTVPGEYILKQIEVRAQ